MLSSLERVVSRPSFWLVVALCVSGFQVGRAIWKGAPEALPVLAVVPEFRLHDQQGQEFGSTELRGKIWIANFIFTRCPTVCPLFSERMAKVRHRTKNLAPLIHLVSFSVDPEHDTPAVLAEYAQRYQANAASWSFLTGPLDEVKEIVIQGLKISMGNDAPDGNFGGIFHGSYFVLVDSGLRIRGYYDANDLEAIDKLVHDAGLVGGDG